MDPIKRLNLFMTMWQQWINSYKNYTYHGQNMRCKSKILYVPFYEGLLTPKTPPPYYLYRYTGNESYGWFDITFYKISYNFLTLNSSSILFATWGSHQPFDNFRITINNPRQNGSIFFNISLVNVECGLYDTSIPTLNYCDFTYYLVSPLTTISNTYGKWGYLRYASDPDKWFWKIEPIYWGEDYIFNWRYNSVSKKYDIWDNKGHSLLNSSATYFQISVRALQDRLTLSYPGTCFRTAGVEVTGLGAYSDVWFPLP